MDDIWLKELQKEVAKWSQDNFGVSPLHGGDGSPPDHPLIGTGEEIGELTTSVLKRAQGIDDSEKYADRVGDNVERDAIGDITIYVLDTLHRCEDDISVYDGLHNAEVTPVAYDGYDDPVKLIRLLYQRYGEFCGKRFYLISDEEWGDPDEYEWKDEEDSLDQVQYDAATIINILKQFCEVRGFEYEQCVREAWEEVSGREWDSEVEQ